MIGAHAGMMGGARTPTPGAGMPGGARRLLLLLRLSGVSAGGGLVTSAGIRLLFDGRLSAAGANDVPVSIDAPFSISNGSALVSVPIDLAATADATVLLIDQVSVLDAAADTSDDVAGSEAAGRCRARPRTPQWRRGERPVKRV